MEVPHQQDETMGSAVDAVLELGDAHILRNAGGIATEDVLRSLIISYHIGGTRELMIINNTKCGMLTFMAEDPAFSLPGRRCGDHVDGAAEASPRSLEAK